MKRVPEHAARARRFEAGFELFARVLGQSYVERSVVDPGVERLDVFGASRAKELGLINAVVPAAELESHALAVCRRLAQEPPSALRHIKALLRDPQSAIVARMQRESSLPSALGVLLDVTAKSEW